MDSHRLTEARCRLSADWQLKYWKKNLTDYRDPLLDGETLVFEKGDQMIRNTRKSYILDGGTIAEPEHYITLK